MTETKTPPGIFWRRHPSHKYRGARGSLKPVERAEDLKGAPLQATRDEAGTCVVKPRNPLHFRHSPAPQAREGTSKIRKRQRQGHAVSKHPHSVRRAYS